MKSIRLLPVVIFAALALLLFKGIGLVTNGSYVLGGPAVVQAADGGHEGGEPAVTADVGSAAPTETVLADTSPTLDDPSPTLATRPEAAAEHGSTAEASDAAASDEAHGEAASSEAAAETPACPPTGAPAAPAPAEAGHGDLTDTIGTALVTACPPVAESPVNENGDALATIRDANGNIVPLATAEGDNSEEALIGRLSERRADLDKRQADLDMRTALLEAAEKKARRAHQGAGGAGGAGGGAGR